MWPAQSRTHRAAIRQVAEERGLNRFVTLTLDPKRIEGDPFRYLRGTFDKFRTYLRRRYGKVRYIAVLEMQRNGTPHLHLLLDRFIPFAWLQESWGAVGGGHFVNVKFVDVHRVSRYLSKYLTKELLLSAPARCRRVTTSRGLCLNPKKPSEGCWTLVKLPIESILALAGAAATEVIFDEEGQVKSFCEILAVEV